MEAVFCELECVINSRPLFYLCEDKIHEALTVFHGLHGRNLNSYKVYNECQVYKVYIKFIKFYMIMLKTTGGCYMKSYWNQLTEKLMIDDLVFIFQQ